MDRVYADPFTEHSHANVDVEEQGSCAIMVPLDDCAMIVCSFSSTNNSGRDI